LILADNRAIARAWNCLNSGNAPLDNDELSERAHLTFKRNYVHLNSHASGAAFPSLEK
jgi:hypothetical protein